MTRKRKSMDATRYLLGSKNNAERLRKAIADLESGKGVMRELIPPKARNRARRSHRSKGLHTEA